MTVKKRKAPSKKVDATKRATRYVISGVNGAISDINQTGVYLSTWGDFISKKETPAYYSTRKDALTILCLILNTLDPQRKGLGLKRLDVVPESEFKKSLNIAASNNSKK